MTELLLVIAVLGTLAIFATTRSGRGLLARTRLRDHVPGAPSNEDVDFLLSACNGDRAEVERRLAAERERLPDLTDAEHHRRAIRKLLNERRGSGPGDDDAS